MTIALISAGFASGIIAGMGIGGGCILVPLLSIFTALSQQQLQGINLLVFIPAAISALIVHTKNKTVDYSLAKPLIAFGIIGAIAGACSAIILDEAILRKIFAVFTFFIGVFQITKRTADK